jgi:hypothetical protein
MSSVYPAANSNNYNACKAQCHSSPSVVSDRLQYTNQMLANDYTVFLLTPQEVRVLWLIEMQESGKITAEKASSLWEAWRKLGEYTAGNAGNVDTGLDVIKLASDLGSAGTRVYLKTYGGKTHIIMKGYPGMRKILNATKYGVKNPKVVQMGLGKYGAIQSTKVGAVITIVAVVAFRFLDYFMRDQATISELIGRLSTDFVKIGVSTLASIGAASLAAGTLVVGSFALGPIVAALAVGVLTAMALEWLDNKLHITDKVIEGLEIVGKYANKGFVALEQSVIDLGRKAKDEANSRISKTAGSAADVLIDAAADEIKRYIVERIEDLLWSIPAPVAR